MHFNAREPLSALIQCLRAFCNGLLRFTRNDGLFTTHHSRLTQTAFTLAETLIVIGIIGVVAALTLPNLNHATGNKEAITKVKKIYSALNDAYDRAHVVYGDADGWAANTHCNEEDNISCDELFANRISEFMKVSKKEGTEVYLADGIALSIGGLGSRGHSEYYQGLEYLGSIWVDIDGPNKGKNEAGKDNFRFDILNQGIYPDGLVFYDADEETNQEKLVNICFGQGYCTKWVLDNDNMDYLKADETGKCPDGTQLSWTVTSCN